MISRTVDSDSNHTRVKVKLPTNSRSNHISFSFICFTNITVAAPRCCTVKQQTVKAYNQAQTHIFNVRCEITALLNPGVTLGTKVGKPLKLAEKLCVHTTRKRKRMNSDISNNRELQPILSEIQFLYCLGVEHENHCPFSSILKSDSEFRFWFRLRSNVNFRRYWSDL